MSDNTQADDGWIEWGGGPCPAPRWSSVEMMARNGTIWTRDDPQNEDWAHEPNDPDMDIIAYRVVTT